MIFLCLGHSSYADEGPFENLIDHYLVKKLERNGEWNVTFLETRVVYECLKCSGPFEAEIEVVPLRGIKKLNDFRQRYLHERKLFCAKLAIDGNGHCLSTRDRSVVIGLPGFTSSQIIGKQKEVETAFFSLDLSNQPIVLKATVSSDPKVESPLPMLETLERHMRRLTPFW